MKNIRLIFRFALLVLLTMRFPLLAGDWNYIGDQGFTNRQVNSTSLAIDGDGTPFLAFVDEAHSNKATVMKFNGTAWIAVGAVGFTSGAAYNTQLAIDANGTPYVAFLDGDLSSRVTVMKFNGSTWEIVGSAGISVIEPDLVCLDINSSGIPHIAYLDYNGLNVKQYTGSAWEAVGPESIITDVNNISFDIDANGTPYVAYQDGSVSGRASVMKYNGSSWVNVGDAGFSEGAVQNTSIAVNDAGVAYILFTDSNSSLKATVMKYEGSNWTTAGTAGFSDGTVMFLCIALSSEGTPYAAYQDYYDNSWKLTVMKYDGTEWQPVGSPRFSSGNVEDISLAIFPDNSPVVAFKDIGSSYYASVMKYIESNDTTEIIECDIPCEFALEDNTPNPFNPTTTLQYGLPEVSDVKLIIFDILGRKIKEWSINGQHAGWHKIMWDGSDTGGNTVSTGVYIYSLKAGKFVDTKKMLFMK